MSTSRQRRSTGLEYIRNAYDVPARRGQRVTWRMAPGRIVSASGPHVVVCLDGKPKSRVILHPNEDELVYIVSKPAASGGQR